MFAGRGPGEEPGGSRSRSLIRLIRAYAWCVRPSPRLAAKQKAQRNQSGSNFHGDGAARERDFIFTSPRVRGEEAPRRQRAASPGGGEGRVKGALNILGSRLAKLGRKRKNAPPRRRFVCDGRKRPNISTSCAPRSPLSAAGRPACCSPTFFTATASTASCWNARAARTCSSASAPACWRPERSS